MKTTCALLASLVTLSVAPAARTAPGLSRIDRAFDVLAKSASGAHAEALRTARVLIHHEGALLKRMPQQRALGLLTMLRFLQRRELTIALESAIATGTLVNNALLLKLRAASLRWIALGRDAGRATLQRFTGATFHGFFGRLRATVAAGWEHVMRVAAGAAADRDEAERTAAIERAVAAPAAQLRTAYLAFQAWAVKRGVDAVREAFDETMILLEEGVQPVPTSKPMDEPVARR